MPPDYYAKSKRATAFVRSHTFVGVGKTLDDATAMWSQLATEAEKTLATPQYNVRLANQRPLEQIRGKDYPATDYPATDYPAPGSGLPPLPANAPQLYYLTAAATYEQVAKKSAAGTAKKSTAPPKRAVSPKR